MLNTNLLTTPAECDSFSSQLTQDREDLVLRKSNLLSQKVGYSENTVTVGSEINAVTARLGVSDTIIAVLPEGNDKRKEEANKEKLNWQLKVLNNRKLSYGALAILGIEMKVAEIDARIAVIDTGLQEVATRKTEVA